MTDKDFRELKELILGLDKKVDVGIRSIKGELKRIEEKLDSKLD